MQLYGPRTHILHLFLNSSFGGVDTWSKKTKDLNGNQKTFTRATAYELWWSTLIKENYIRLMLGPLLPHDSSMPRREGASKSRGICLANKGSFHTTLWFWMSDVLQHPKRRPRPQVSEYLEFRTTDYLSGHDCPNLKSLNVIDSHCTIWDCVH